MAARRLQRYADFLNAFDYEIEYVNSKENCAEGLSRLPMPLGKNNKKEYTYLSYVKQESFSCLDHKVIAKETRKDRLLSQITLYLRNVWPEKKIIEDDVKPFVTKKRRVTYRTRLHYVGLPRNNSEQTENRDINRATCLTCRHH